MIKAILACDSQGGVGKDNNLPWPPNAKDLKHFKQITSGHTVVMGSKTWMSSMPTPLPNRKNVVVTRNPNFEAKGATLLTNNISQGLTTLAQSSIVFVIGGANLFAEVINDISFLHLTRIAGNYDCDTFIDLDVLYKTFVKIDSVEIDNMTKIETYVARNLLHDIYLSTNI
jgi:dihydrofolate reductase